MSFSATPRFRTTNGKIWSTLTKCVLHVVNEFEDGSASGSLLGSPTLLCTYSESNIIQHMSNYNTPTVECDIYSRRAPYSRENKGVRMRYFAHVSKCLDMCLRIGAFFSSEIIWHVTCAKILCCCVQYRSSLRRTAWTRRWLPAARGSLQRTLSSKDIASKREQVH